MVKWLVSAIDLSNKWIGLIVSYIVLVFAGITLFEVFLRFGLDRPTNWAQETTQQLFGFYLIMGGGYALLYKAHIRIDVLWNRLSPKKKAFVDLATGGIALLFLGVLLWFSGRMAWFSIQMGEHTPTPWGPLLYPLKISLVIGVALILLQFIAKTIRDLYLVIKGDELA